MRQANGQMGKSLPLEDTGTLLVLSHIFSTKDIGFSSSLSLLPLRLLRSQLGRHTFVKNLVIFRYEPAPVWSRVTLTWTRFYEVASAFCAISILWKKAGIFLTVRVS